MKDLISTKNIFLILHLIFLEKFYLIKIHMIRINFGNYYVITISIFYRKISKMKKMKIFLILSIIYLNARLNFYREMIKKN